MFGLSGPKCTLSQEIMNEVENVFVIQIQTCTSHCFKHTRSC